MSSLMLSAKKTKRKPSKSSMIPFKKKKKTRLSFSSNIQAGIVAQPTSFLPASLALAEKSSEDEILSVREEPIPRQRPSIKNQITTPDSLIASLITNDLQSELAPAIKSVFEQRKEKEVIESLDSFINKKAADIENLCVANYEEFIRSISEIKSIREDIHSLKSGVMMLNSDIQKSGKDLTQRIQQLVELRWMSQNITSTIELVNTCLYVLELTMKVKKYVGVDSAEGDNKPSIGVNPNKSKLAVIPQNTNKTKFYPAIKILESLQHTHLKNVTSFSFGLYLQNRIPLMRDWITKRVTDDVNSWFLIIREKAPEIGRLAMQQTYAETERDEELALERQPESSRSRNKVILKGKQPILKDNLLDKDLLEVSVYELIGSLTFAPLYQCFYIYQSLEMGEQFTEYYKQNRKRQADLVLSPAEKDFVKNFQNYFNGILGFFIVENTVTQTAPNLVTTAFKDQLWAMALDTMREVLKEKVKEFDHPTILSEFKDILLLFCQAMKAYGYDIGNFLDFVRITCRDRYMNVAMAVVQNLFKMKFNEDNYINYTRNDRDAELIGPHELEKITGLDSKGMQTYPFSKVVPSCIKIIKQFLLSCDNFATGIPGIPDLPDMDRLIIKSTEVLIKNLTVTYVQSVSTVKDITLAQASVAYTNMVYMQKSIPIFEEEMERLGIGASSIKLDHKSAFEYAFENLQIVLEQLVELFVVRTIDKHSPSITWNPEKAPKEPKPFILELVDYSSMELPALPRDLYTKVYSHYYKSISKKILSLLSHGPVSQFNRNFCVGLLIDISLLEDSIARAPVKDLSVDFEELRQLLTLLTTDNIKEFLDEKIRTTKYSKLTNYKQLLIILEKFENASFSSKFNISFFQDDRTKQTEAVKQFLKQNIK